MATSESDTTSQTLARNLHSVMGRETLPSKKKSLDGDMRRLNQKMSRHIALFLLGLLLTSLQATATPPFAGTIFIDPDIITAADPSVYTSVTFAGSGNRLMFDRRVNAFVTYNAFLFNAVFNGGATIEIQVNPEFGTAQLAQQEAAYFGLVIGRLPRILRTDVQTVWIHKGTEPFGGGNHNLLIHTGQATLYSNDGILEETLVHEASHTSLDAAHGNAPGWLAAQAADGEFISTYARDFPDREDIAESFLPYLAVRHRRARISTSLASTIEQTIPGRLSYFDSQSFDITPLVTNRKRTQITSQ